MGSEWAEADGLNPFAEWRHSAPYGLLNSRGVRRVRRNHERQARNPQPSRAPMWW